MSRDSSEKMLYVSRMLRSNMTKEERRLWYDFLKALPVHVNRQKPLDDYVADFYIACAKLIIEVDGSSHYSEQGKESDSERDAHLAKTGNLTLRYSNYDINSNFEGVCLDIAKHIEERSGIKVWN